MLSAISASMLWQAEWPLLSRHLTLMDFAPGREGAGQDGSIVWPMVLYHPSVYVRASFPPALSRRVLALLTVDFVQPSLEQPISVLPGPLIVLVYRLNF
jgi:hypothetical protein